MNFGIIAAGEGSRLAQEGIGMPKPLVEINGRPMIRRLLDIFASLGAESVAVVANADRPETARYLESIRASLPFSLKVSEAVTPSSMHTFAILGEMLRNRGRFITTTVDTVFGLPAFSRYATAFRQAPEELDGMMAVTGFIDDEKPLYVETDSSMRITAFSDTPAPGSRFISAGIYGLDTKALDILDRCIADGIHRMRNFQRALVADGLSLEAFDIGKAVDVDHARDLATARELDLL